MLTLASYVTSYRLFNVSDGFSFGSTLRVTSGQGRATGDDEAVLVLFKSYGKLHNISSVKTKPSYIIAEISKSEIGVSIGRTFEVRFSLVYDVG